MNGVALRILLGDRAKYIGLIFGIAFSTMLMSNQTSIFIGLMLRTANQILDAREADIWSGSWIPASNMSMRKRGPEGWTAVSGCARAPYVHWIHRRNREHVSILSCLQ